MRVLICGDRHWKDEDIVEEYIKSLPSDTVVIQGMCRGADIIARSKAHQRGLEVKDFPTKWDLYGRAAGPIRNRQMIEEGKPDLVVAFHNDLSKSKGTANMLKQARERGIPTEVRSSLSSMSQSSSEGRATVC